MSNAAIASNGFVSGVDQVCPLEQEERYLEVIEEALGPFEALQQAINEHLANNTLDEYEIWVQSLAIPYAEQYNLTQKIVDTYAVNPDPFENNEVLLAEVQAVALATAFKVAMGSPLKKGVTRQQQIKTANDLAVEWAHKTFVDPKKPHLIPRVFTDLCGEYVRVHLKKFKCAAEEPNVSEGGVGPIQKVAPSVIEIPEVAVEFPPVRYKPALALVPPPARVREHPHTSPEDAKGPDINEAMLASIARTAFVNSVRIPQLSSEVLRQGNKHVEREFGANARRLLIVGPDAIIFGGLVHQITQKRPAELLAELIKVRGITKLGVYLENGLFRDISEVHQRRTAVSIALRPLIEELLDDIGEPLAHTTGNMGGRKFGIDDVVVRDIRGSNAYKNAREQHAEPVVMSYILKGGVQPTLTDTGAVLGARSAMRKIGGDIKIDRDQEQRFKELNDRISAMYDCRTDEYLEAHVMEGSLVNDARHLIADTLAPSWQDKRACGGTGGMYPFYPPPQFERKDEKKEREARAKKICSTCQAKQPCLDYALTNREPEGIWGGLNEKERKAILKGEVLA